MKDPSTLSWVSRQLARPFLRQNAPLALALLPALTLASAFFRKTPLSYDHATHLFKAWHFWEEMIGRGRLRGWTHFWAFGFPSDELVPMGGEVWVALFRVATFAQLSWLRTYALAFAGMLIFKSLAAYCFTRGYLGRGAGVACAWITLLDPGGMLEGGWEWHTYWGVWPVTLAMSLVLFSLTRLEQVLTSGRVRDVFWAGAWFGMALLTHQMALLALAIAVPLLLLDHVLRPTGLKMENAARALGALGFGGALSAFFLLPFLARSKHTQDLGWLGDPLAVVSQRLVELHVFQNVWAPVHGLALLGAWFALRRRVRGGVFLVGTGALLVLLSSGVLLRDLHLERVSPSLIKIEANRFLLVAKLFWFALSGYGLVQLFQPLLAQERASGFGRRALGWGVGLGLGLALLAPGYRNFYDTQIAKAVVGEDERAYWPDFPEMLERTRELRQSSSEHYRIAYHFWRGDHLSTLAPVFNQTLMYKVGSTPTQIYDKIPMTDETELYEALSVKYVVSGYPIKLPTLKEEQRFGALRLYRFTNYRPEPFEVLGEGQGELLEFSPERLRIRLTETAPNSRLKIHVASFDRWRASFGGEEVPIVTVPVLGAEYPMLMEVPARDGELVLEYVYRSVDWLGLLVTLGAVPGFFGAIWCERRYRLLPRAAERLRRAARPLGWAVLAAALLLSGVVAAGTRTRAKLLPAASIFHRVEAPGQMTLGGQDCVKRAPLSFECGWQPVRADLVEGVWGLHLCMTAPLDAGELRVRVQTTLGSFLVGNYDPKEEGAGSISVSVDGRELGSLATRPAYLRHQHIQFDTRDRRQQKATVEVRLTGNALRCFDLQTSD